MSVSQKLLTFPHPCLGICSLTCSQGADPCTVLQQLVCKENQTAAGERQAGGGSGELGGKGSLGWVSGNKEGADMQEAERFQMETARQKHRGQKAQGRGRTARRRGPRLSGIHPAV